MVTSKSSRWFSCQLHGVASQAWPFEVLTEAFGGTVLTVKISCVPRVTVAQPETLAPIANKASVIDALEKRRIISCNSPLALGTDQARAKLAWCAESGQASMRPDVTQ